MNILSCRRIQFWGFFILICALAYLQIYRGAIMYERASKNYIRLIPQPAPRGIIIDRNNVPLVRNRLEFNISIFLKKYSQRDDVLMELSRAIGVPFTELLKQFNKNYLAPFIPTSVL